MKGVVSASSGGGSKTIVDDERISIEKSPGSLTTLLTTVVNNMNEDLNKIGELYLTVYRNEPFPLKDENIKEAQSAAAAATTTSKSSQSSTVKLSNAEITAINQMNEERKTLLSDTDQGFIQRYRGALKEIGDKMKYPYYVNHIIANDYIIKDEDNGGENHFSMGAESMEKLHNLERSLEPTTLEKTTTCIMSILASRQSKLRMANHYPLCLFVPPRYNASKEMNFGRTTVKKIVTDGSFEKTIRENNPTSLCRYERIVFSGSLNPSDIKLDDQSQTESVLSVPKVTWVAFALLPTIKENWKTTGPYIKVWTNVTRPQTTTTTAKTTDASMQIKKQIYRRIGESVVTEWKGIFDDIIKNDNIFHKESVGNLQKDPSNLNILQSGDLDPIDNDDVSSSTATSIIYGKAINFTGSKDPHSIYWPMTQCSMYKGLDMFVRECSSIDQRMYTQDAVGENNDKFNQLIVKLNEGNNEAPSVISKGKKKKTGGIGSSPSSKAMNPSLLWTTGVLIRGIMPYIRHTQASSLKTKGYTLNDPKIKIPSSIAGITTASVYKPVVPADEVKEDTWFARPHLKRSEAEKILSEIKKSWQLNQTT